MTSDLLADAHAVLLPLQDGVELEGWATGFLRGGGRSLLLGESREEYVARQMSPDRRETERPEAFTTLAGQVTQAAGAAVLIAVDQELGGIQRLHGLVPALPSVADARDMASDDLVLAAHRTGAAAIALGVTMFLSPVLDVLTGANPWLAGRAMGTEPADVARIGVGYVRGVQTAGVLATAKHFPGFRALPADPALTDTVLDGTFADLQPGIAPFRAAIDAGVGAVMIGPANVTALDAFEPAATSSHVVRLLREQLGFTGLVVSDDIDAPATRRGRSVPDTAVASLTAGADLLLLAGGSHLSDVLAGIEEAVADGRLERDRLGDAADRTRRCADASAPQARVNRS